MRIRGPRTVSRWDTITPNGAGSVIVEYEQTVGGAWISGGQDRFYVSSYIMTSNPADWNYYLNIGTMAGTVESSPASTFTLTGLTPGRQYFVFCARYDAVLPTTGTAQQFSYLGRNEIIYVPAYECRVFPANHTKTYDPATDDFFDAFAIDVMYRHIEVLKGSDADGDFWRLTSDPTIGTIYDTISVTQGNGLDRVSPEYPFTIQYKIKHNAPNDSTADREQQFSAGFNSGNQALVMMDYYRAHRSNDSSGYGEQGWFEGTGQWSSNPPYNYDDISTVRFGTTNSNILCNIRAHLHHDNILGGADPDPAMYHTVWAETNHPSFNSRIVTPGVLHTFKLEYTGAPDYEVKCYLNDYLVTTLGSTEQPLAFRRRLFYGEHYKMPISPHLWIQFLGGWALDGGQPAVNIDIYELSITTECPYAFAGWKLYDGEYGTGSQGLYHVYDYGATNMYWIDPSAITFDTENKFDVIWPQGNTARGDWDQTAGVIIAHDSMENSGTAYPFYQIDNEYDWTTQINKSGTFLAQPVTVPPGLILHSAVFIGNSTHGTARGRIVDSTGTTALTPYSSNIADPANPESSLATASASVVRAQFELAYSYDSGVPSGLVRPDLGFDNRMPSADGVLLYFFDPAVTGERSGNQLQITGWTGATIYYSIDGGAFNSAGSSPASVTIQTSYTYIDYYASDGTNTSNTERYYIDTTAPQVSANLPRGTYRNNQLIILTAIDEEDPAPIIKYRWRVE